MFLRCSLSLACTFVAACPLLAQQAGTDKPAKVAGRVVQQSSGEPIRRAAVSLRPSSGQGEVLRALSDAQGNFVFAAVGAGEYRLLAERNGFLPQEFGARGPSYRGTPLAVAGGQEITGLVFKLTPQGVLTGKVLDEEGEVVADAEVMAFRQTGVGTPRVLRRIDSASTNDLGEFRIPQLNPGSYLLVAEAPDLLFGADAPAEYAPTFFPGTTDPGAAVPLAVRAGQEASGIIQLRKTRVFNLRGRVVGVSGGLPVRAMQVKLVPRDPARALLGLAPPGTIPAADGSFAIAEVQPGAYYLTAAGSNGKQRSAGRVPVEVGSRDVEGVSLIVDEGMRVGGVLRLESEGPKLQGTVVSLAPAEGPSIAALTAPVQEDGTFQFEGVPRDRYLLNFYRPPEGAYVKTVRVGGQDARDQPLDLTPSFTGPAIEILLGVQAGAVDGQVSGEDDQAAPGVTVVLAPDPARPNQPFLYKRVVADLSGRFRVPGLAPGDYKLYAFEEETGIGPSLDAWLIQPPESATKVTVEENGSQTVSLKLSPPEPAQR